MINGMKCNKNKCHILLQGCSNFRHCNKLGQEWLDSSLGGRTLGVLLCSRLSVSAECPGSPEGKSLPGMAETLSSARQMK